MSSYGAAVGLHLSFPAATQPPGCCFGLAAVRGVEVRKPKNGFLRVGTVSEKLSSHVSSSLLCRYVVVATDRSARPPRRVTRSSSAVVGGADCQEEEEESVMIVGRSEEAGVSTSRGTVDHLQPRQRSRTGYVAVVATAAAVVATSCALLLPLDDTALAYKGGGPYGQEVTRGQDLTGKDFSGLDLRQQDFKTSILRRANFKGSKLVGASFFDSDLTAADLSDTDLRSADFSLARAFKANFTNAILEGAAVTGNTSFDGATITGADFTDVLWREDQRKRLCDVADGVNPITGNSTRETLACE